MATLVAQSIVRAGLKPVYAAAAGGGDEFVNGGDRFIHIKNGDSEAHTITIATPNTVDGLAISDRTVSVPAGEDKMIGPFPTSVYNDGAGKVQLSYDGVTSVTIAVLTF